MRGEAAILADKKMFHICQGGEGGKNKCWAKKNTRTKMQNFPKTAQEPNYNKIFLGTKK